MSDISVPPELLAILQCPIDAGALDELDDPPRLVCQTCGRAYPVAPGGIPDMVVDDAG
ncbi:MAG TPA: Trm112 family protein [Acidimicrobiia bacterium]|jgi:uncharacterized protein YbaR (Trm112 family)|nr:Trm112 family protein [Acidimicrobiia bacterium]